MSLKKSWVIQNKDGKYFSVFYGWVDDINLAMKINSIDKIPQQLSSLAQTISRDDQIVLNLQDKTKYNINGTNEVALIKQKTIPLTEKDQKFLDYMKRVGVDKLEAFAHFNRSQEFCDGADAMLSFLLDRLEERFE